MADPTIETLNADEVEQAELFLISWLQAEFPSMDLTEGRVLRNLLIRPAALFHVLNQTNMDNLRQSMSLKAITENPDLATPGVVDAVLSNFRVTRHEGTRATGTITIATSLLRSSTVNQGTVFNAGGLLFTNLQTYVAVTEASSVLSDQQRLLVRRTDGTYAFTVPVSAEADGSIYVLRKSTRLTMSPAVAGFIDAFATEDFAGGSDTETNQELINRFPESLAQPVFSGRAQIAALLLGLRPEITAISTIGFGDAEMLRDRHNIFQISTGGKADMYTRTQVLPEVIKLRKTATLVDLEEATWQFPILRDDAPGFYIVESVVPADSPVGTASLAVLSDVRGLDLTPETVDQFVPDIADVTEGAYSRYQTAVVQFTDDSGDQSAYVINSTTREYDVYVSYMPGVKDLQLAAIDRENRNPQADYLIRAPIPAFTTISLTVAYKDGTDAPDASEIQQAVADRVNSLNFELGRLPNSTVFDAIHDVISKTDAYVVAPIDMMARIRRPDGSVVQLRSANSLDVPNEAELDVTQRTTVFYLDKSDVDVQVQKAGFGKSC